MRQERVRRRRAGRSADRQGVPDLPAPSSSPASRASAQRTSARAADLLQRLDETLRTPAP